MKETALNPGLVFQLVILLTLLFFLFPGQADAYLDPGTGSYILQLLVGAVLGGIFTLRLFWKNIKSFVAGLISRNQKGKDDVQ